MGAPKQLYRETQPIADSGYTKICIICNLRFDQVPELIGCERVVTIERCEKCSGIQIKQD